MEQVICHKLGIKSTDDLAYRPVRRAIAQHFGVNAQKPLGEQLRKKGVLTDAESTYLDSAES